VAEKSLRTMRAEGTAVHPGGFLATPYNQVGTGSAGQGDLLPHIIADFDLRAGHARGLVKSLVLDKRRELGALPNEELQFKADRDDTSIRCCPEASESWCPGWRNCETEVEFACWTSRVRPKMLVVCE